MTKFRKWNITIRLIVGRGWGQGPTHSQNLQSIFHIFQVWLPIPTTPYDAKGLLTCFERPKPVIFLEHRWLHSSEGIVPSNDYEIKLNKSKV